MSVATIGFAMTQLKDRDLDRGAVCIVRCLRVGGKLSQGDFAVVRSLCLGRDFDIEHGTHW